MLPRLLPGAELSLSRLVSQLRFEDTGDTLRKAPLQEYHLQSLLPLCNLDDAHDLLKVTILYMGHDGLLRSGEMVSGLRPRDVIWGPGRTSMSVRFARSKTHRTGGPFQVFFKDRPTPNALVRSQPARRASLRLSAALPPPPQPDTVPLVPAPVVRRSGRACQAHRGDAGHG